jgi:Zn-dependent protease with chaperone function
MAGGWLYDGISAARHAVEVSADGDRLVIRRASGAATAVDTVPATDVRFIETRGGDSIYGHRHLDGWRLGLAAGVPADLAALLPAAERYGRWIDRIGLVRASLVGGAVTAAVLFAVYQLPHWVAPYVPDAWLDSYGEALVGDFGGKFCKGPGGQRALDALVRRLAPERTDLKVRVVNIPVVNAAALPGGNIVIFAQLLGEAKSADEFAGVLAHEIGHVENRDIAEMMVREFGFGLVISSVGGSVGSNAHSLLSMAYGREAETRADEASIRRMAAASIDPAATAGFFDRMAKLEGDTGDNDVLVYFSTHPVSKDRARTFRAASKRGGHTPALTPAAWDALVDICHNDSAQRPWFESRRIDDARSNDDDSRQNR